MEGGSSLSLHHFQVRALPSKGQVVPSKVPLCGQTKSLHPKCNPLPCTPLILQSFGSQLRSPLGLPILPHPFTVWGVRALKAPGSPTLWLPLQTLKEKKSRRRCWRRLDGYGHLLPLQAQQKMGMDWKPSTCKGGAPNPSPRSRGHQQGGKDKAPRCPVLHDHKQQLQHWNSPAGSGLIEQPVVNQGTSQVFLDANRLGMNLERRDR